MTTIVAVLWQIKNGGAQKGENAMFDRQTKRFCSAVVDALPVVPEEIMQGWIDDPMGLQEFLRGLSREFDLLKLVGDASVKATKRFVAKDNLQRANVGLTGNNFDRLFLNKVENGVKAGKVVVHELKKASLDEPILDELGDRAEISLAHFFELLEKQKGGGTGVLLTNGYANIAYIRDAEGNLWAVLANWYDVVRYWYVEAFSVERPDGWNEGLQVLSRK